LDFVALLMAILVVCVCGNRGS